VARRAEELLDRAAEIETELQELAAGQSGLLRVAGFSTAWASFLPPAIAEFSRERPDVRLELDELEPEPSLEALLGGRLDVAVVYLFEGVRDELDRRLDCVHLLDDPYALALPRGHPVAARPRISLSELAGDRWLSPPLADPYAETLRDLLRTEGGFAPRVHETRDVAMAQPLIAAGVAVGALPALNLLRPHEGIVVRPLPAAPLARSVFAVRVAAHRSPLVDPLITGLEAAAAETRESIAGRFTSGPVAGPPA
jgi:DNA-binding transcriptional LysR family regulator